MFRKIIYKFVLVLSKYINFENIRNVDRKRDIFGIIFTFFSFFGIIFTSFIYYYKNIKINKILALPSKYEEYYLFIFILIIFTIYFRIFDSVFRQEKDINQDYLPVLSNIQKLIVDVITIFIITIFIVSILVIVGVYG